MFLLTHHNQTDRIFYFGINSPIKCLVRISKQVLSFVIQLQTGIFLVCFSSKLLLFNNKLVLCKFVSVSACFPWIDFIPYINFSVHKNRMNTSNFIIFQLDKGMGYLPICLKGINQHLKISMFYWCVHQHHFWHSQWCQQIEKMSLLVTCAPSADRIKHEEQGKA